MSDLKLDPLTGDLAIVDGDFVVVGFTNVTEDVRESIRQDLSTNLKFFFGEWFLDTLAGVPWFELVFIKNPNATVIDGLVKNVILNVPGILGLEQFSIQYIASSRAFLIEFVARTTTGPIDFGEEITVP